jgi:hypothetical protein
MYYISRIFGAITLAALGIAVWFSIVLARADFYFRTEKVQRAMEIAPRNTEYLALRALQLNYDGGDSRELLQKIAALNPYSSAPRIRLGLAAEVSGDLANAERWLLEAANVDHQFEPRWTLANFYFRAGNKNEFWRWMRAALEVSYGDRAPAYDLCWRVSDDAAEILRRGIPDRHDVVASYLVYVLQKKPTEGRLQPVANVARRLAAFHDAADLPLLLGACDRLIADRNSVAVDVWVSTGHPMPVGIFNGDLAAEPLNHGFDWRAIESPGVTRLGNRIALSGQESESCLLLERTLNLEAGKRYRLQWEARTVGMKSPSGLEWRLEGQRAALSPSADWTAGELAITAEEQFQTLELAYRRPVGESRAEGSVELRHIRLVAP